MTNHKQREIKFRAWDKKLKVMREVYNLELSITHTGNATINNEPPEKFELMQFTGLLDRNRVEIFEGDVIKIIDPHVDTLGEVVYWAESGHSYATFGVMGSGTFGEVMSYGNGRELEVIGNIYEHPNLLTKSEDNTNG